jgi:hypothetical protein
VPDQGARACDSSAVQETIMFAQLAAKRAAVPAAAPGFYRVNFRIWAAVVLAMVSLGGCLPTARPLTGADPADPGAKVAATTYRSTTAPYTAMRPAAPAAWGSPNSGTPTSRPEKSERAQ